MSASCAPTNVSISKADFDKLAKEHKDFRNDAAVLRAVITAAEAGVAVSGIAAGLTGNFGPLGSTDDSLVRLGFVIGGTATGLDAARRAKSIVDMYRS